MSKDSQINLRVWPRHVDDADRLAAQMSHLPAYELLRVTRRGVLRLALAKGVEYLEDVDPRFFQLEEAQRLANEIARGGIFQDKNLGPIHVPFINGGNVMLTPGPYIDHVLMTGIVAILSGQEPGGTDVLVNLRVPTAWLERIGEVVRKSLPEQRSAVLRLAMEVGLFRVRYDIYWARVRLRDEMRDRKSTDRAATPQQEDFVI